MGNKQGNLLFFGCNKVAQKGNYVIFFLQKKLFRFYKKAKNPTY